MFNKKYKPVSKKDSAHRGTLAETNRVFEEAKAPVEKERPDNNLSLTGKFYMKQEKDRERQEERKRKRGEKLWTK